MGLSREANKEVMSYTPKDKTLLNSTQARIIKKLVKKIEVLQAKVSEYEKKFGILNC
ncbi:MAG: hypothetical protein KW793_03910 [Candidatus Doudnabacteria bacterium]|nr:hypothetical protein [Candidatus Doudnabacteria bacterium]